MMNPPDERGLLDASVRAVLPTLIGWCSEEKALRLVSAVLEAYDASASRELVVVEIGVFGGSSFIPMGLALQSLVRGGVAYGIDPWRRDAALESMVDEANRGWWGSVDLDVVYAGCRAKVRELELERHCRLIRARSEDVVEFFDGGQIDVLHVDGNHSEEKSLADVAAYLPRVRSGGLVFFDDVSWHEAGVATTTRAISLLRESADELAPVGDCAVFRKR